MTADATASEPISGSTARHQVSASYAGVEMMLSREGRANAPAVLQPCGVLDGLYCAIELRAGWQSDGY